MSNYCFDYLKKVILPAFFSLSGILFMNSGYAQQKISLFKDINTEQKTHALRSFTVANDSLVYFVSYEKTINTYLIVDSVYIYVTNGTTTALACKFADGRNIEFYKATNKKLFFRQNDNLYALDGVSLTLLSTEADLISGDCYVYKNQFIYKKFNLETSQNEMWMSDGTANGTAKLFDAGLNAHVQFLGSVKNFVYYAMSNFPDAGNKQIWKLDITTRQSTFLGMASANILLTLDQKNDNASYFYFYTYTVLYVINVNADTVTTIVRPDNTGSPSMINNQLYITQSYDNASQSYLYQLNTNTLAFEIASTNVKSASFQNIYQNKVYFYGKLAADYTDNLYQTDTLFQNFYKIDVQDTLNASISKEFYFKGNYYRVYQYDREHIYADSYFRIYRVDRNTRASSIFLDSYQANLHKSMYEEVMLQGFIHTKNQFFFTIGKERGRWNSDNRQIIGEVLWRSSGDLNNKTEFFKTGKNTLNAGIHCLTADKNDLFFFADRSTGFQLMTAQSSSKDLRPFLDSTLIYPYFTPDYKKMHRIKNKLFFQYSSPSRLAVADGTKTGTKNTQAPVSLGFYEVESIKTHQDFLYFISYGSLWKTNGDTAIAVFSKFSTHEVEDYGFYNDNLYFIARTTDMKRQLYKYEIASSSMQLVFEINYVCCLDSRFIGVINNKFLFSFSTGFESQSLYSSDGTTAGTSFISDIPVNPIENIIYFKNQSFLFSSSRVVKTDGTAAGTGVIYQTGGAIQQVVATKNFIAFYLLGYNTQRVATFIVFDGSTFTPLPEFVEYGDYFQIASFAASGGVLFYHNDKTYINVSSGL